MNTIDKKNSINRDLKNQYSNDRNLDKDLYNLDETKKPDNDNREIAERGYTVRNGHNPNRPNPDQEDYADSDLDDLSDDFHSDRDLEDNDGYVYEVELEDEEVDELDNPSDLREDEYDFNETEDVLEDIDDDDNDDDDDYIEEDVDEDNDYIEDDVQEDNDDEEYPENDPRRF